MDLKEHLENLEQQKERAKADYNAILGAIQFCQQLIKEQEEKDADESN